ncbi:Protein of unknown function DUF3987) [uncultured Caudovirales phage]|uniref:NrS-1 polymerase-like HBD domain-containing protein n=1 Tax=uncultured Caudovirales phage TaxID=2100421 RepID=A0A6J5RJE2_9CAUD|nr:Protein of unknown function DUF3987) [uncultured Caudovirales phage]
MPIDCNRLPEELCWTAQWCVAGPDDNGKYRVPNTVVGNRLRHADPTDPRSWGDFETAREFTEVYPAYGLGFVLSSADPYVCIDLDIKNANNEPNPLKWTSEEIIARHHKIIEAFDSYTERSASGQGFHIWLRGGSGRGARRDGVEVYSQERFIVCTGDVFRDRPIVQATELLDTLIAEMRRAEPPILALVDNEQTESDETIFARAVGAENSSKFIELCNGRWQEMGYPSQSEADAALLTMLAFYTKSNSQVFRMFRTTMLGKRDKAVKNDYYLGMSLRKIRSIEAAENESAEHGKALASALLQRMAAPVWAHAAPMAAHAAPGAVAAGFAMPSTGAALKQPQNTGNIESLHLGPLPNPEEVVKNGPPREYPEIAYPPGFVGEVADYIFRTAPRPVREVAIVAALGLFAGICGKSFCIPQSGLNLYVILVGQSGVGKEAMHSGISTILRKLSSATPDAAKFVDFSVFVSAPALMKAVSENTSFVNVCGEFGKTLERMSRDASMDMNVAQLRTAMTNLYQKSGPNAMLGGLGYSDKDKNTSSVTGAAYSMIGETTPGTLYDSLTDSMMADGFLSRFTMVEYSGSRPAANRNPDMTMSDAMIEHFVYLCKTSADTKESSCDPTMVAFDTDAQQFLDHFDVICDKQIDSTSDEGWRQMWNRAHLKALRIAAILAVADNHFAPKVELRHATWAYDLIMRDIAIMMRRVDAGDVGSSDSTRENKLLSLCVKWLTSDAPVAAIHEHGEMVKLGIIPRKYFQLMTQRVSSFNTHKLGQAASLDMAVRSLMAGGYLQEVPKAEAIQKFSFHGACYRILNLPSATTPARQQLSRAQSA